MFVKNSGDFHPICSVIQVYFNCRCTTVRYITTHDDVFGADRRQRQVARRLLEILVEMNLSDNPVLFHIFSNGGCMIYNAMRDELKENSEFEDLETLGVVYDSAPGNSGVNQRVSAVFQSYPRGFITSILKMGLYAFMVVTMGLNMILNFFGIQVHESMYDKMLYYQDGCPELYLFSKADELVSATDVENTIDKRRMQGVDITSMSWDDSPHVQHLRVHRESYITQCRDFVKRCLKVSEGEAIE